MSWDEKSRTRRRHLAIRLAAVAGGVTIVGALAIAGILQLRATEIATAPSAGREPTSPGSPSSPSPSVLPSSLPLCAVDDFALSLSLERERYRQDEPVMMTLIVRNASGRSCTYAGGARDWNFETYEEGGASPVWSDGACKPIPAGLQHNSWAPPDKHTFQAAWDHMKNDFASWQRGGSFEECQVGGGRAAAGHYQALGTFTFNNGMSSPERREFTLRTDRVSFWLEG